MSAVLGRYRNHAGAEIEITHTVVGFIAGRQVLGTVYGARQDGFLGGSELFITPEGIKECGYVKIADAV